jgi:carbon-monoxide dehydrogenase medium subunit
MIPAAFDYTRARTLAEALEAVGKKNTKVICGGQTLIPLMRFRLTQPKRLVDIGQLPQLRGVTATKTGVRIGAATTYREIIESPILRKAVPLLPEITAHIADLQVRNIGTIGGSLVHADPSSDMPAAMLALDATFHLQSSKAKRTVRARDFFRGAFETAMKSGELMIAIEVPSLPKGTGAAYETFEQAASGYALVAAAAVVTRNKKGLATATLAFTGLADAAFLAGAAADLVGTDGNAALIDRVTEAAVKGVDANSDIHATAEFRLHLARIAARRALLSAISRAT